MVSEPVCWGADTCCWILGEVSSDVVVSWVAAATVSEVVGRSDEVVMVSLVSRVVVGEWRGWSFEVM